MRAMGTTLITILILTLVAAAAPAFAETTTETQSFVNSSGNTVTVESTYVDGVLVSRTSTETRPDGSVVISKSWDFYPSGAIQSYEEYRYSSTSTTHIMRDYSEDGVLLFQRSELYVNGELTVVSLVTYDSSGNLLTQETRKLTTLADGTQVWEVTVSTYQDGVLVSTTVTQYPYGYNFDAPAEEALPQRPGYGYGDKNHKHTGPPGLETARGRQIAPGLGNDRPGRNGQEVAEEASAGRSANGAGNGQGADGDRPGRDDNPGNDISKGKDDDY